MCDCTLTLDKCTCLIFSEFDMSFERMTNEPISISWLPFEDSKKIDERKIVEKIIRKKSQSSFNLQNHCHSSVLKWLSNGQKSFQWTIETSLYLLLARRSCGTCLNIVGTTYLISVEAWMNGEDGKYTPQGVLSAGG